MALLLKLNKSKKIKIIARTDSSLNVSDEQYDKYLESGADESLLTFNEGQEPTRFVFSTDLKFDEHQEVLASQIKVNFKGKKTRQSFNLGYILVEMKMALKDIENPEGLEEDQKILFKKDSDGNASEDLISLLHSGGVLLQLHTARSLALGAKVTDQEELKNV